MRTADDVIKDWTTIQSGRTRYEGQALRDDEIMLAEVLRLRAENADMRVELVDDWQEYLQDGSVNRDGWFHPYMTNARHSGLQLHKLGLVEKHPDREAYRFVKGGG